MSRKLALFGAVLMLVISATAEVQTWKIDPNHTAAQFSVRHMGISTVRGAFTKVSGSAQFDPASPAGGSVEVTIDAASVDTRVTMRDDDLRSPNYLDASKFPTLTFKSTSVKSAGAGKLVIAGDLPSMALRNRWSWLLMASAPRLPIRTATLTWELQQRQPSSVRTSAWAVRMP